MTPLAAGKLRPGRGAGTEPVNGYHLLTGANEVYHELAVIATFVKGLMTDDRGQMAENSEPQNRRTAEYPIAEYRRVVSLRSIF
jgi:hypothetical protein